MPSSWEKAIIAALASLDSGSTLIENDGAREFSTIPSIYLVRGTKRTGKSTFSRTLLNRLLKYYRRVAYLECDVGQTEFTPPGLVSLNIVEQPLFGTKAN